MRVMLVEAPTTVDVNVSVATIVERWGIWLVRDGLSAEGNTPQMVVEAVVVEEAVEEEAVAVVVVAEEVLPTANHFLA